MWCPRRLGKVFQQLITCWPSTHILRNLGEQQYAGMLPFFWCKSAKKSILSSLKLLTSLNLEVQQTCAHVVNNIYIYIEISNSNIHIHYIYTYIYKQRWFNEKGYKAYIFLKHIPPGMLSLLSWIRSASQLCGFGLCFGKQVSTSTVDGQNPAPPRMMIIPLFIGF